MCRYEIYICDYLHVYIQFLQFVIISYSNKSKLVTEMHSWWSKKLVLSLRACHNPMQQNVMDWFIDSFHECFSFIKEK